MTWAAPEDPTAPAHPAAWPFPVRELPVPTEILVPAEPRVLSELPAPWAAAAGGPNSAIPG